MNTPLYFIFGSCISRDAFGGGQIPNLAGYAARAPLGSVFAPKPDAIPPQFENLSSAFQRRMVETDWEKTLPDILKHTDFDLLLVDFIDERFDLAEIGGSLVSVSNEFQRTEYPLTDVVRHRFGSSKHTEAFGVGFQRLIDLVGAERIVVSRAYWARELSDGRPTADAGYVDSANVKLERLYSIAEAYDIKWIEFTPEQLRGATDHKWGVSPFHYVKEFYDQVRTSLAEVSSTSAGRPPVDLS